MPLSDLGYILIVELLRKKAGPSSILTDNTKVLYTVVVPFYTPSSTTGRFLLLYILTS